MITTRTSVIVLLISHGHGDIIPWKHCPHYWPFVRWIPGDLLNDHLKELDHNANAISARPPAGAVQKGDFNRSTTTFLLFSVTLYCCYGWRHPNGWQDREKCWYIEVRQWCPPRGYRLRYAYIMQNCLNTSVGITFQNDLTKMLAWQPREKFAPCAKPQFTQLDTGYVEKEQKHVRYFW